MSISKTLYLSQLPTEQLSVLAKRYRRFWVAFLLVLFFMILLLSGVASFAKVWVETHDVVDPTRAEHRQVLIMVASVVGAIVLLCVCFLMFNASALRSTVRSVAMGHSLPFKSLLKECGKNQRYLKRYLK